jgi:microcystin-dependent protein
MPFAGTSAYVPSGWLVCDGRSYAASGASADLQSVLNAASFSALPDLQGRVAIGLGTNGDVSAVGNNEGITLANVANRSPKHKHSNTLTVNSGGVDHSHGYNRGWYENENPGGQNPGAVAPLSPNYANRFYGGAANTNTGTASAYNHTHPMGGIVGVGSGIDDTMPYLALNYIIKN